MEKPISNCTAKQLKEWLKKIPDDWYVYIEEFRSEIQATDPKTLETESLLATIISYRR